MLRDLFSLFPAYAGVILIKSYIMDTDATFPRIRGGDPQIPQMKASRTRFSPHTRG